MGEWFRAYGFGYNPLTTKVDESMQRGLLAPFGREEAQAIQYIESGEMFAITGEPGTGKTALMRRLCGMYGKRYNTFFVNCSEDPQFDVRASVKAKRSLLDRVMRREYPSKESIFFLNETRFLEGATSENLKVNTTDRGIIKSLACAATSLEGLKAEKSFVHRIGQREVRLGRMRKDDAMNMASLRFKGGKNPFTRDAVEFAFTLSKGNRRKFLEILEISAIRLAGKGSISANDARKALKQPDLG